MIFGQIWERYFLREFLKTFLFFIFCFYGLYVLVDYASHMSVLLHKQKQVQFVEILRYYLFVFASRAEILLPMGLLIALIRTVCSFNTHHELVALMASGFKLKTLMRPFLTMGLACTVLLFLNEQYLLPPALKKLRQFENVYKEQKRINKQQDKLEAHAVILEDSTLFLYQDFEIDKDRFFDTYWIKSVDDVYRIKYLAPRTNPPTGYYVDHLTRQPNGELALNESMKTTPFPEMRFSTEILQSALIDPDALSLSELWDQRPFAKEIAGEKESKMITAFFWKLFIPWLCVLAIIAPAPFCVRYARHFPLFLIYACGIFGLLAYYLVLDASQVLAKRQVIQSPALTLGLPFFSVLSYFGWRFFRMR